MKKLGIPIKGARVTKAMKIETVDTGARHPVAKARRQRTKDKVTGVKVPAISPGLTPGERISWSYTESVDPMNIASLAIDIDAAIAHETATCAELLLVLPYFTRERAVELLRRRAGLKVPKRKRGRKPA